MGTAMNLLEPRGYKVMIAALSESRSTITARPGEKLHANKSVWAYSDGMCPVTIQNS